ncbi:hypothetical protein H6F50_25275 [Coleofasciculus sp. FACHB-712]|uniref:hypothetical protein n=1 Tax=Coleofasciculus sp. FACHB-712 TaxID=2692789 RepID=UPI00168A28E6|nr:hypothetical protein [Coleofasciculus sp. FACHB-712]MBD1945623.1 hypothetical protein [Coleofasciculus sp. FACHB-712]
MKIKIAAARRKSAFTSCAPSYPSTSHAIASLQPTTRSLLISLKLHLVAILVQNFRMRSLLSSTPIVLAAAMHISLLRD